MSIHQVGNKSNEEPINFSNQPVEISGEGLNDVLQHYFFNSFEGEEFYNFTFSGGDLSLNPLYQFTTSIFDDDLPFHENSKKIAQYLYDVALHPNIKSGDLFVVKFSNLRLNDQLVEAIGLFKSENKHAFLTLEKQQIQHNKGIHVEKLDKGCIVFNRDKEDGYRIAIVDKSNRLTEAQYWKDTFLNLKARNDGFQNTKAFLSIAKSYVKDQITEEFQLEKADQLDLLNRSVEYFKQNESFNKQEFEESVFQNEEVISSFREFDNNYRAEHEIQIRDEFEISNQAVKKQSRFFKSILKLDKNFHVYIHGDRSKIERGEDADGRKFYKIYYEKEN